MSNVELSVSDTVKCRSTLLVVTEEGSSDMYAFAALAMFGAWYFVDQMHHVGGMAPPLLLVGAMLSVAMHILRRSVIT